MNDALTRDPNVDATEIQVKVDDGIVMLTGTVDDRRQKRQAENVAERILGVRDVTNQLRVERRLDQQQHETREGRRRPGQTGAQARA